MEKRKLVLTIIGVVILAMVIMVYIYFSKPGRDEKKNQQTINQVQNVTLPGYQGLYFQGVGENIRTEDFGFEAQKYITDMIIVAPQLNDWGQTSADQTIELTQYFLTHYIINPSKVYINGYSGGGETLSLVLAKQPELYTAALMCSSQWDGCSISKNQNKPKG